MDPTFVVSAIIICRDVDGIFVEYHAHLVLENICSMLHGVRYKVISDGFIEFPILILILFLEGDPPRPPHKEILEEEQARADHVVDAFSI